MLKKFARVLSLTFFRFYLFALAFFSATLMVFGNPTPLKNALGNSKIYDHVADNIIDSTSKNSRQEGTDQNLSLDAPETRLAFKESFSPLFFKDSAENVIDGVYGWLNQETAQPEFEIDFGPARQSLAQRLGDNAANRYNGLPNCTPAQLRELRAREPDPLNIPCKAPGRSSENVKQQIVSQIATSDTFSGDQVINANTLAKDEQGEPFFQKYSNAPEMFENLRLVTYLLGFLSLVSAVILLYAHDSKRKGLKNIGLNLIIIGTVLLIAVLISTILFSKLGSPSSGVAKDLDAGMRTALFSALGSLNSAFQKVIIIFGALYVGVGAAGMIALHFARPIDKPTVEPEKEPDKLDKD